MRRGLIARSPAELPDAVLDARLARVRAAMAQAQLDALLIYTNNTRPAGVSWLIGFVPYWSEALLVVPRERAPVLVVALTYRVKSWIERTSRVAEVIHTPRIGLEAARVIAAVAPTAAVGIADLDGLPVGIMDDLRAGGPGLTLRDATAVFAVLRAEADPAEIALAVTAASIAQRALAAANAAEAGAALGEIIAAIERKARELGAEEIYLAAAPDLSRAHSFKRIEGEARAGTSFALRATVAYKGAWIRLARSFGNGVAMQAEATARLAAAVAELPSARGFAGMSSWLVEGCRVAQPLAPLMGSRIGAPEALAPGALVSVQATIDIAGRPVPVAAPALIGRRGEAASLLLQP
jgi:Creatinase/Prolidase N-terminal domain